jgi:general secretion pathway protein D
MPPAVGPGLPAARRNPAPAAPASTPAARSVNAAGMGTQPPQPSAAPTNRAPAAATNTAPAGAAAPAEEANIKYNWSMPVEEMLDEIYAPLVGRTPLRAPTVPKDTLITLKTVHDLTRTEAIEALEAEMGMNGITVVPMGDKFFKVVLEANAPPAGGTMTSNASLALPDLGKFITEVVQLKYADPDQVVKALGLFAKSASSVIYIPSTESLILRDYTENVKRMLEMVEKLDVESSLTVKSKVIPIRYALAGDISAALSQLGAGGGGAIGHDNGAAGFKSTTGSSSTGTATGMGGLMGGGGLGQASQTGLSTGAGGARSTFGQRLGSIVNGATGGGAGNISLFGQTKIIADERTNSLLVFANDEDMKMIEKIIGQLDVVLAQVLIEAVFLDVHLDKAKNIGISYSQNPSSRGPFTGAGGVVNNESSSFPGASGSSSGTNGTGSALSGFGNSILPSLTQLGQNFSYFGSYGQDFNATLEAVATDSHATVLSRPQIQTSHAVEAELFIGRTIPYITGTQNYGYSTGPSSTYTQLEVGIRLRILPLINPDGLVVMDIDVEIEGLGNKDPLPGGGYNYETTKNDAGAKVAVMSGQTIILGGFIDASRTLSHDGVPWLMDIPVLGNLFKGSTSDNSREELVIMIRPTVLKTPEIAAQFATEQRNQMAAVKQAELEIRKDEDARNAKANKELLRDEAKKARQAGSQSTNPPVELHLYDTNSADIFLGETNTVDLHLSDTNSESVIEKAKP